MRYDLPYKGLEEPLTTDSTVDKVYLGQRFGGQQVSYKPLLGHPGQDVAKFGFSFPIDAMFEELCVGSFNHYIPDNDGDGKEEGYGNVYIAHAKVDDEVIEIRHAHLKELIAEVGRIYKPGELIGEAGATGRAYGVHDHLEIIPIKPEAYGKQTSAVDRLYNDNGYAGRVDPVPYIIKANQTMENVLILKDENSDQLYLAYKLTPADGKKLFDENEDGSIQWPLVQIDGTVKLK